MSAANSTVDLMSRRLLEMTEPLAVVPRRYAEVTLECAAEDILAGKPHRSRHGCDADSSRRQSSARFRHPDALHERSGRRIETLLERAGKVPDAHERPF